MLTKENQFRFSVLESDQRVLPIPNVVAPSHVQDDVAEIVAVEIEPECVYDAVALVDRDQNGGRIASTTCTPRSPSSARALSTCIVIESSGYILFSGQPLGPILDVIVAGQEDMLPFLKLIQFIEVRQV